MSAQSKAILYILIASIAFSFMNLVAKQLSNLPVFELVLFRAIGTSIICTTLLVKQGVPILGSRRPILLLRAVIGCASLVLFFWSIKTIPIGTATSLRFTSPIFAAILAVWILKEKIKPIQWLFFLLAFIGVIVIKGFDLRVNTLGFIAIILSAILVGIVFILIRKIGDSEHHLVIINYFMLVNISIGGLVSIFYWQTPVGIEWSLIVFIGIIGFIGQYFMTQALQTSESNMIVPFKYSEVVFSIFFAWIIFGEQQSWLSIYGILLIIAGLLGNYMVKAR